MKKTLLGAAALVICGTAMAENITGSDQIICSAGSAQICIEAADCYAVAPWELAIPDFVVIDTGKKTVSTTKASGLNRSTRFSSVEHSDGTIFLQGNESGRAFSFVIDEATGRMTVAVARDGFSVAVFGACTDTKL